jgi:signal peptidase I
VRRAFWKTADASDARTGRRSVVLRWGVAFTGALTVFHLWCPFSLGVVQGSSMTPTYRPGQLFLLDRRYYSDHPLRRGDVVVVRSDDHTMIKRVFGLAGDSIWLLIQPDGDLVERYIVDNRMLPRMKRAVRSWDLGRLTRLTVPPGTIYLLGDCSEASVDSRAFGPVPVDAILGRVTPWRPGVGAIVTTAGASAPSGAGSNPASPPVP